MFLTIPTYHADTDIWTTTDFEDRPSFLTFLWSLWKEPGKYEFDESSFHFNAEGTRFTRDRVFCLAPLKSKDYINYWNTEKNKCQFGVIFHNGPGKTWYVARDYYMWLNFLPIYDKEIGNFGFPKIRDAQYHMALYEVLAEYSYKHCAILKKRQIASSYFHAAKMINRFWFESGWINKMAASLKDYINEKGTWRFLEEYRNFLNEHTAWYRPTAPDKLFNWEQKVSVKRGGRDIDVGLKSVLLGLVLDKDATNGVGGPCNLFYHEEAGVAPNMNKTVEYALPSLKSGMIYTGMIVVAGSVGELTQCEPLKEMIMYPDSKDVLAVECKLVDAKGTTKMCGLFIPEQWSMLPCIDSYGNSMIEWALELIMAEREKWKTDVKASDRQLRISQKPTNIEEAFAVRATSDFPAHLVSHQIARIQDNTYHFEHLDIFRNEEGLPEFTETFKTPIDEFPISPKVQDKEGALVILERPIKGSAWGTYYGSIDPVMVGKTDSSESLCSIYIWKNQVDVTRYKANGTIEAVTEPGKLVAWWCGRFDDLAKTHERLSLMIEIYNAWTIVENNVTHFIQYMIDRNRQKYLVPKDQIMFLKEIGANSSVFQDYGWKNNGAIFKENLVGYAVEMMTQEIDKDFDDDGNILHVTYGVERFPDIMLFREMQAYRPKLNVDRLIAFCALMAFVKVQQANRGVSYKRTEHETLELENAAEISRLKSGGSSDRNPFRHIGTQVTHSSSHQNNFFSRDAPVKSAPRRSPFKNLR